MPDSVGSTILSDVCSDVGPGTFGHVTDSGPDSGADAAPADDLRCYRHPDRIVGVSCQRCERPICPDCMKTASVGFHCPECVSNHGQRVLTPRDLKRTPVVTVGLIAANALVFLVDLASQSRSTRGGSSLDLTLDGLLFGPSVADGDWWRVITSGFLHSSWLHLGSNLLMLWILGQTLEPMVGRVRFGGIYTASLVAGSVGVLLLDPRAPTLGASGAVFGVLGALVVMVRAKGISLTESGLGPILVVNLLITFGSARISVGGHLGGLAGGLVVGWIVLTLADAARAGRIDSRLAVALSMVVPWVAAAGLFAVALALAEQI